MEPCEGKAAITPPTHPALQYWLSPWTHWRTVILRQKNTENLCWPRVYVDTIYLHIFSVRSIPSAKIVCLVTFLTLFFLAQQLGHAPLVVIFFCKCTAFPSSIGSLPPHSHVNSSVSLAHAHFCWTRCIGLSPIVQCARTFDCTVYGLHAINTRPNMLASRLSKKPKIYWPHDKNGIAVKLSNRQCCAYVAENGRTSNDTQHIYRGRNRSEPREW